MASNTEKYVVTNYMKNNITTEEQKQQILTKLNSGLSSIKVGVNLIRQAIFQDKNINFVNDFRDTSKGKNPFYFHKALLSSGYKEGSLQNLIGGNCSTATSDKVKKAWNSNIKQHVSTNSGSTFSIAVGILPYTNVVSFGLDIFSDSSVRNWYDNQTEIDDFYAAKAVSDYFYRFLLNSETINLNTTLNYISAVQQNYSVLGLIPTDFGIASRNSRCLGWDNSIILLHNKSCY